MIHEINTNKKERNILNLRKEEPSRIKIVEKIIFKRSVWWVETLKIFACIVIVSLTVWGISKAAPSVSHPVNKTVKQESLKNFSAMGLVSDIASTSISLSTTDSTDSSEPTIYTFDASSTKKIETADYSPLTFSDINLGDQLIIQGTINNGVISIRRIIRMTTSTADVATTTPDTATSTSLTLGDASSTLNAATSTTLVLDVGSSTPSSASSTPLEATSSPDTASSTPSNYASSIPDTASSTIDTISTSTPDTDPTSTPSVISIPSDTSTSTSGGDTSQTDGAPDASSSNT